MKTSWRVSLRVSAAQGTCALGQRGSTPSSLSVSYIGALESPDFSSQPPIRIHILNAILVRPSEKLHLGVLSTQESAHNPSGCGRKWGAKDGKKEMSAGESKEDKVCGEASYMCTGTGTSLVPCAGRLFEHGLADTCFT